MGYHYPRSLTTAVKSAGYFRRFCEDFGFCVHDRFDQVYATSEKFSWTNAQKLGRPAENDLAELIFNVKEVLVYALRLIDDLVDGGVGGI